jgi:hypothetical protein
VGEFIFCVPDDVTDPTARTARVLHRRSNRYVLMLSDPTRVKQISVTAVTELLFRLPFSGESPWV